MADPQKTRLEIFNLKVDIGLKFLAIAAVGALFVFREQVMDTLAEAGINKVKLPFFEVEIAADDADAVNDRLKELLDQVSLQEQRAESLAELIKCSHAESCSRNQQVEIATLVGSTAPEGPEVAVIGNLQRAVLQTDEIIQSRGLSTRVAGGSWIIVVGADKSAESAEYERRKLERSGFDAKIARKGTWLRTYAEFATKSAATDASSKIQELMGRKVYVTEFATWCPDAPPAPADGFVTCG